MADHVEVPGGLAAWRLLRRLDELAEAGVFVHLAGAPAPLAPTLELGQQHPHDAGLERVQTRVPADLGVRLLVLGAVEAQPAGRRSELLVVGDNRTAVTDGSEV